MSRLANILSFLNALSGTFAIFFAASGNYILGAHLIALAMFFDTLDGPIARWQGPTNEGKILDRFSDRITQCVAPAVVLLVFSSFHPVSFILGGALVFTGLLRLIRSDAPQEHPSQGLPLSPSALLVVTGVFLDIRLPIIFGLLAITVALSLSTISFSTPNFLRKPVVSSTDWKQFIFIAVRSLPLLLLVIPILPLYKIVSLVIFFAVIFFVTFGISYHCLSALNKWRQK